MRKQRAGHIISISSSAGLAAGFDVVSAYAAWQCGLEGWMESLHAEVALFGITTTVVNPAFFRTEHASGTHPLSHLRIIGERVHAWRSRPESIRVQEDRRLKARARLVHRRPRLRRQPADFRRLRGVASFRPGLDVRERGLSGRARDPRDYLQHEPAWQLLRQRGDGSVLLDGHERGPKTVCEPRRREGQLFDYIEVFYNQRRRQSSA